MKDYYAILGLRQDCDKTQIRRAYRKKAKRFHPDHSKDASSTQFLLLKEAYAVLSNTKTRSAYNQIQQADKRGKARSKWDYREFLYARREQPEFLTKLICYNLLNNLDSEAIELYEQAKKNHDFLLKKWLDRENFMDFTFLLAEAYLVQKEPEKAYHMLYEIAKLEEKKPYFRHFYSEILGYLSQIVLNSSYLTSSDRIAFLQNLIKLSLSTKDRTQLQKKLSHLLEKN